MATIDEHLNVRTEIEQAVAKQCNYTEFNPVFDEAFENVNSKQMRIMQLYFIGELTYSEIAKHEKVSYYHIEKTVKTIIQAVDEKLKETKEN